MVEVKAQSDIGAVAEAVNNLLRLIRDFIDPDKNDRRAEDKRMKHLIKARNEAVKAFDLIDGNVGALSEKVRKQYKEIREDFDKEVSKT
jgi:hypothetical protein